MRSTEDKLLDIPLNVGMNQAVSERLAPTGTLSLVYNCRTAGNGVLEKRPGSTGLTGTTANPGGHTTGQHSLQGDGVNTSIERPSFACQVLSALLVGNTSGDAFAFSTVWQFQGCFSTCLPVRKRYGLSTGDAPIAGGAGLSYSGFGFTPPDIVVTASGYLAVIALTTDNKMHFYVEDVNGVRLFYKQLDGPFTRVRLAAQSDVIILAYQDAGALIFVVTVTIAAGQITEAAAVNIATLSNPASSWDLSSYNAANWYLAHQSGAALITLTKFNGTASSSTATFACTGRPPITLFADPIDALLWVGFFDNPLVTGDVAYTLWDISATIVNLRTKTTFESGTRFGPPMFGRSHLTVPFPAAKYVFFCYRYSLLIAPFASATKVGFEPGTGASSGVPGLLCWHVLPISKPDNYNRVWCIHHSKSSNQLITKYVLLKFPNFYYALSAADVPTIELSSPNLLKVTSGSDPLPADPTWFFGNGGLGSSRSFAALPTVVQQFYGSAAIVKLDVYEYTTAQQEPHRQATRFAATTTIAGQPVEFFGQSVATIDTQFTAQQLGAQHAGASEIGFPHAPIVSVVAGGAGSVTAGTRSYRCTFEWIDMYGRRHQSAPSNPVSVTINGTTEGSATLTVSGLNISQRQTFNTTLFCTIRVYRTVAGGTEYHELTRVVTAWQPATGYATIADGETDDNIAQDGFIYTDGGVLADDLAPSCRFICKSEDRLWFGGLWDTNIVQCSKVIVPGEPIQCTDDASHQVQLPAPCTALAYMDGSVVAFTADAIYVISGDGPNDQGAGAFAAPRCITRSVGCCDYRSVVETNSGVMFQANQGFYLLPRGFGPTQYVGAAVLSDMNALSDPTQDLGPVVLGSVSHTTRGNHLARFLVALGSSPAATGATDVFTYDLDDGQWFHDTIGSGIADIAEIGAYDSLALDGKKGAVFVRGDLSTATSTTPVWIESAAQPGDDSGNSAIVQVAKTAWIHPFGLGGFGKVNAVLFALESLGATQTLDVTVQTDTNTIETASWVITGAQLNYRLLVVNVRACTAVQVQLRCQAPSLAIGGFKFISITLEVEPTNGIRLLSDAEKT